ncbi:MAG: 2-hydroxychromene-2-carboxylate isomerase [Polyangiaceae bacterium]
MPLTLYFDFISPYAYLAWAILKKRGEPVVLEPILFAGLLNHHGQLGPAEIPAKRQWLLKDTRRQAQRHGVPLGHPASHPFRPLTALRVSQRAVAGEHQPAVVSALFHHGWVAGGELGDDDAISEALTRAGLDGDALVAAANQPPAKEALKQATAGAIEHGVFGVPTLSVDGELFWGSDRIDDALAHRDGELVITDDDVRDAMTMPATAHRKQGS